MSGCCCRGLGYKHQSCILLHPPATFLSFASALSLGITASGVMEPEAPATPDALPAQQQQKEGSSRELDVKARMLPQ